MRLLTILVAWVAFSTVWLKAQTPGKVLVSHAPTLNGVVVGLIQQMIAESVTLNGSVRITGDLFVPGTPGVQLNGNQSYGGTLDGPGAVAPTKTNGPAAIRGWIIGAEGFAKTMVKEHHELVGHGRRLAAELQETREALWQEELAALLLRLGRTTADLSREMKSAPWKSALAAAMKKRTTATNRWLGAHLHMGGLHEVSRLAGAWLREPDPTLRKKLGLTTNYKA